MRASLWVKETLGRNESERRRDPGGLQFLAAHRRPTRDPHLCEVRVGVRARPSGPERW